MTQDYQINVPDDMVERLVLWYDDSIYSDEFDMKSLFIKLLASLSLSMSEKCKVLDNVSELSIFQLTELEKVFDDERTEFLALLPEELDEITQILGQQIFQLVLLLVYLDMIDDHEQKQTTIHHILTQLKDSNAEIWESAENHAEAGDIYWRYLMRELQEHQHFVSSENQDFERLLNGKF